MNLYLLNVNWVNSIDINRKFDHIVMSAPDEDSARAMTSTETNEEIWLDKKKSKCLLISNSSQYPEGIIMKGGSNGY